MKFLVIAEGTCHKCNGDKEVMQKEWVRFFKHHPELPKNQIPYPSKWVEDWFFDNDEADFVMGMAGLPPIKWRCGECGGTGVIRQEVSLEYALSQMQGE